MLEIGSLVDGKYKILNKIGQGGMSVVYLAMNEKANKQWAIKEVRKDGVKNFEVVKQGLIIETDLLKKLDHPNLPSIIDVIDADGTFLIVMDYIQGNPLSQSLEEEGAQPQEQVIEWAKQLCDVLEYLHTRQPAIIYRDMKPANIMLKPDGNVTLIDFGTAREYKDMNVADTTCLGTQGYAAPEQFGGQGQTDARTDVYCLGTTLYHLVTGHNPCEPPYEIYPIRHWNPNLSSGLEKIIVKCTQRNPEDRYQSCAEMLYALEHYDEIDDLYIRKQKRKLRYFIGVFITTLIFSFASLSGYVLAESMKIADYTSQIDMGNSNDDYDIKVFAYLSAISIEPTNEDAYLNLIEVFTSDLKFTEQEAQTIEYLRIGSLNKEITRLSNLVKDKDIKYEGANVSKLKPLDELKVNSAGYANVCYKIGEAYWLYYDTETEISKKTLAYTWFSKVLEEEEASDEYLRKAAIYCNIGEYYKNITRLQYEGNDDGEYKKYWDNLIKLKEENDKYPNQDAVVVRLHSEIISQIAILSYQLKNDGVTKEELLSTLEDVRTDLNNLTTNNEQVRNEIKKELLLCETGIKSINTAYGQNYN